MILSSSASTGVPWKKIYYVHVDASRQQVGCHQSLTDARSFSTGIAHGSPLGGDGSNALRTEFGKWYCRCCVVIPVNGLGVVVAAYLIHTYVAVGTMCKPRGCWDKKKFASHILARTSVGVAAAAAAAVCVHAAQPTLHPNTTTAIHTDCSIPLLHTT